MLSFLAFHKKKEQMDEGQGRVVRKKLSQRKNILKIEKREV